MATQTKAYYLVNMEVGEDGITRPATRSLNLPDEGDGWVIAGMDLDQMVAVVVVYGTSQVHADAESLSQKKIANFGSVASELAKLGLSKMIPTIKDQFPENWDKETA